MRKTLLILTFVAAAIILASCEKMESDNPVTINLDGSTKMRIAMHVNPELGVHTGEVTISKGDMVYSQPLEFDNGNASVLFSDLQPGVWLVEVELRDEDDYVLYQGNGEAGVVGGQTNTVTIVVEELSGDLEVIIEFPGGLAGWPQIGFDAARTSFNPDEETLGPSNVDELAIAWTNMIDCTINSGVSVADGVVYYGNYCGEFRAVDAATGETLWTRQINRTHTGQAVIDGVVYVSARCTYDSCGMVYAFDAATGEALWTWNPGPKQVSLEAIADNRVYVHSREGDLVFIHALDAQTGGELWVHSPGRHAAVAEGVVYLTDNDSNTLQALDAANGDLLWTGSPGGGPLSQPAVANGVVYVHADAGFLYAFDAAGCGQPSCLPLWKGATEEEVGPGDTEPQPPAIAYGNVYVGANETFYAFAADGCGDVECLPVWTATTACTFFPGSIFPPSVANGVVYSTCDNNYIYAFDAEAGDVLWSYYTSGGYPMRSSPAVVDGRLYHPATFDFKLYAFESE